MIGILDSGLGGLAFARVLSDALGDFDIIYFANTARGPIANNSPRIIRTLAVEGTRLLVEKGAHLILVACQDISSVAVSAIKEKFPIQIIDSVTPCVEKSLKVSRYLKIGVIGSRATILSGMYEKQIKAINAEAKIYSSVCPLLMPIVEEGWIKKPETKMIIKKYIQPLKIRKVDTLISACSYYSPLFKAIRRKAGKRVKVIDSSAVLADHVVEFLKNHLDFKQKLSRKGTMRFFVSDINAHIEETGKRLFGMNLTLEQITP